MEHAREDGSHEVDDVEEDEAEHRDDRSVDQRERASHDGRHGEGEHEAQRGSHGDAHDHHERLLDVVDVGGEARHERARGELVDVGEAEALDVVEHVATQVLGKAAARVAARDAGARAEGQREQREQHEDGRGLQKLRHGGAHLDLVDEAGCEERDGHLAGHLYQHQQRRGYGHGAVVADGAHELAHDGAVRDAPLLV